MSIIIDNFLVNTALPIDTRIVASGSVARNSIEYKYHGLRVWDTSDNIPYVWNGTSWANENSSAIQGSGTVNFLSKFTNSGVLGNSSVFDNGSFVGIGTTTQIGTEKLRVNGQLNATSFKGDGSEITLINAGNITSGLLNLNRLTNGAINQILLAGASTPVWTNLSSLTIGNSTNSINSTNSDKIKVALDTTNIDQFLTFVANNSGYNDVKVSTIKFNTNTNQLFISNGSETLPTYSFLNSKTSGIYLISLNTIGISTNGVKRIEITDTYTSVLNAGASILRISTDGVEATSNFRAKTGASNDPSYTFTFGVTTGMYLQPSLSNPKLSFTVGADKKLDIDFNGNTTFYHSTGTIFKISNTGVTIINGTVTTPAYGFKDEPGMGIYRISSNNLGISVAGVNKLTINATATTINNTSAIFLISNTTNVSGKLEINGNAYINSDLCFKSNSNILYNTYYSGGWKSISSGVSIFTQNNIDGFHIYTGKTTIANQVINFTKSLKIANVSNNFANVNGGIALVGARRGSTTDYVFFGSFNYPNYQTNLDLIFPQIPTSTNINFTTGTNWNDINSCPFDRIYTMTISGSGGKMMVYLGDDAYASSSHLVVDSTEFFSIIIPAYIPYRIVLNGTMNDTTFNYDIRAFGSGIY